MTPEPTISDSETETRAKRQAELAAISTFLVEQLCRTIAEAEVLFSIDMYKQEEKPGVTEDEYIHGSDESILEIWKGIYDESYHRTVELRNQYAKEYLDSRPPVTY